ncbi:U-box domain-containing protein 36 [Senna tora]|uniref:U-box domain-containing protein 36 n=1 Tax=Senna tora TaxID=362788 RepID=A0A834SNP7_9FABA|nr:U-box domain-containing protein 36 [Senna tora]
MATNFFPQPADFSTISASSSSQFLPPHTEIRKRHRVIIMEDENHTPSEAKEYYSKPSWWPETTQASHNGIHMTNGALDHNNSREIITPEEISETFDISGAAGLNHYSRQVLSSEIVEIVEESKSITSIQDRRDNDVYVAVGKDDLDVVKWALDHALSPSARIFLIHVSPPITLIPTPVGKILRSQLSAEQVRVYMNEENNRRKNLLQKYIKLCTDAKITADALLLESNDIGKAILDLISILNITNLVIGIKKPPNSPRRKNKVSEAEFVKKNAPEFCEVTLVYNGRKVVNNQYLQGLESFGSGHVSAGHGRIGKHRKHPGGRGNAGGMHHHRILFDKYHPGYFGKVGMRYFHKLRNKFYCPIVNIDKLWSLVPQELKDKASKDNAPMIDVTQYGYFKVLGKGVLPENKPVVVKAKLVSKIAEKKIKEAGGAVVLTA